MDAKFYKNWRKITQEIDNRRFSYLYEIYNNLRLLTVPGPRAMSSLKTKIAITFDPEQLLT